MSTYDQRTFKKHSHHFLLDINTQDMVCLCGKLKGAPEAKSGRKWVQSTPTNYNGHLYASAFEAQYAEALDWDLKAKKIKSWERQVPIPLVINGITVRVYRVDFVVHHFDGLTEWIETKGRETEDFKWIKKLVPAVYAKEIEAGLIKYTIVKQVSVRPRASKFFTSDADNMNSRLNRGYT
jgi:hypothetical protein